MATPRRDLQPSHRGEIGLDVRQVILERGAREPVLRMAATPQRTPGDALVRTLLTGIDGTDEEVLRMDPEFPRGADAMVLGHECLGEVVDAPGDSGLVPGDLVVPLVRHGCDHCEPCMRGLPDMCASGDYLEHGIKGLHGFMRDMWTDEPDTLVRAPQDLGHLAVLTEPLSIVVKALEQAKLIQQRIPWFAQEGGFLGGRALVAGAGSLGSLATFLLLDEGMDVWVMDRHPDDTFVARTLRSIGATHVDSREQDIAELAREIDGFDLVVEATGVPGVLFDVAPALAENGILAALGVPAEKPPQTVDADDFMRRMVLGNQILFGSVNSNRSHFEQSFRRLRSFRSRWPQQTSGLLTRSYHPDDPRRAFHDGGPEIAKKIMVWNEPTR